jgi:hypothetical protein
MVFAFGSPLFGIVLPFTAAPASAQVAPLPAGQHYSCSAAINPAGFTTAASRPE